MSHPLRVELERLSAAEVNEAERARLESHVEACPECRGYLEGLEAERRALHRAFPPSVLVERVEARARRGWRPGVLWAGVAVAGAAVAVVAVLLFGPRPLPDEGAAVDGYRLMGSPAVRVVLRREGRVRDLRPGEPLRAGDGLRLEVTAGDAPLHVSLLALDLEPRVEAPALVLVPEESCGLDEPCSLEVRGQTVLPGSVVVDDDPAPVCLALVAGREAFDLQTGAALAEEARARGCGVAESSRVDRDRGSPDVVWTLVVAPEAP